MESNKQEEAYRKNFGIQVSTHRVYQALRSGLDIIKMCFSTASTRKRGKNTQILSEDTVINNNILIQPYNMCI